MGWGDRHVGGCQRRDHPELAVDLMGRGDELARRLLAQHEVLALAAHHFGRKEEGRVGMARIELAHAEAAAIPVEIAAQIAVERRHVEAVALHDGNGIRVSRHRGRACSIAASRAIMPAHREKPTFRK